jgi:hypothetical protein
MTFDVTAQKYRATQYNWKHYYEIHLPANIENAFSEGAGCLSIECFNAAATMFRLCVDLATRPLLPVDGCRFEPCIAHHPQFWDFTNVIALLSTSYLGESIAKRTVFTS